jgi:hypothetical protein
MEKAPPMNGMILRYRGCPDPPDSPHYHEFPHLVIGEKYEVAEIFEMDGHLMVRKPGQTRWPAPGEDGFGVHPEWFEYVDEPIPILSCGYEYNDTLCNYFGVLLDQPEHIEIVRALRRLEGPDDDQTFETWNAREGAGFPEDAARALFDWLTNYPYDFGWVSEALLVDPPVNVPFAFMGAYGDAVFRMDVRHADLKSCIDRVLRGFGIRDVEAGVIDCSYWRGTGKGRLINPSTAEKFLYGINYERDEDPDITSADPRSET